MAAAKTQDQCCIEKLLAQNLLPDSILHMLVVGTFVDNFFCLPGSPTEHSIVNHVSRGAEGEINAGHR